MGVRGLEFGVGEREGGGALHACVTKSWMMVGWGVQDNVFYDVSAAALIALTRALTAWLYWLGCLCVCDLVRKFVIPRLGDALAWMFQDFGSTTKIV